MMAPVNDRDLLAPPGRQRHSMGPGAAAVHAMGRIETDTNVSPPRPEMAPAGDLLGLGFTASSQQYQQGVTNGYQNQVVTSGAAPTIAGIGRIEPSVEHNNMVQNKPKRKVILVPTYTCNGGMDTKFNHYARHAQPTDLHHLLTPEEYEREILTMNDKIKKARAKRVDFALLATGPLMVPLALWGARHGQQVKRKRKLIEEGVWEFNERMGMDGRNVKMIWNRAKVVGGGDSYLTIEEVEESGGRKGSKKFD